MVGGRLSEDEHNQIREIFQLARNKNLLWRYEILAANGMNATDYVDQMEDDIFWDLSEIDPELKCTKSMKITHLPIDTLPDTLSTPITSQIIDFSHNGLKEVPSTFFDYIPNVRILRLASNQLETIPWQGLGQLKYLRVIDFRHNPWDELFLEKFRSYIRMFHPRLQRFFI